MERYVLVPDSFKGTLRSGEICNILQEEILRVKPDAEVVVIPVADGGEGSVDAFLTAVGGKKVDVPCHGPHMEEMTGFYVSTIKVEMKMVTNLHEVITKTAYEVSINRMELVDSSEENSEPILDDDFAMSDCE